MSYEPLEDYKAHCYTSQQSSDQGYATALVAESVLQLAKSVDLLREMLKERLDDMNSRQ